MRKMKTSQKYILIVVILVAIIAGGILLLWPLERPPDFMCSKEVTVSGYIWPLYSKLPGVKHVICSNKLSSSGIQVFYPAGEIPCIWLETSQEFLIDTSRPITEGTEITISGVIRCIDNRKSKNPDCELSSIGCELVMWLKEFTKAGGL